MKGTGPLLAVARELAWRKVRQGWRFDVAHIPTEDNDTPDALSHQFGPDPPPFPTVALKGAIRRHAPDVKQLWKIILKAD